MCLMAKIKKHLNLLCHSKVFKEIASTNSSFSTYDFFNHFGQFIFDDTWQDVAVKQRVLAAIPSKMY